MRVIFRSITSCLLTSFTAQAFIASNTHFRQFGSSTKLLMVLKEGDKLPMDAVFQQMVDGKPTQVPAADLFAGKKVVICGVPGAMTPTCSEKHLPGFIDAVEQLKSKGVDTVACISVNDPFVMGAWGKALSCDAKVQMLADGGASFAKSIGHEFDTKDFGGIRLKRLAMLVEDGVVKKLGVEEGGAFTDLSNVQSILDAL